ncbi:MAG: protein involved in polysaccharide export with SLBB domain [Arenicella sp.]|jgi:protein involved in polysaccharide export with SLBB domain
MKNKMKINSPWVLMSLIVLMAGCTTTPHLRSQHEHDLVLRHSHEGVSNEQHMVAHSASPHIIASPATGAHGGHTFNSYDVELLNNYLISPGDQIELTYHVDVKKQDTYNIAIGDQIRVEFFYYPQLDRTLNVRPDGKVTLPNVGDIEAAGLTPMALADRICKVYRPQLREPTATVSLIRYGERIRELKDAITTSQRGQSRLLLVQPDGRVSIPLLNTTSVAGLGISEAESLINELYKDVIPGMVTTAALSEVTGNKIYVYGEVKKPGYYRLDGPTSVTQSIALAGGFENHADPRNILVITRNSLNQATGSVVNIKDTLSRTGTSHQTVLRQADVVYVSKTGLGSASIIGEAIRRMIPISFSVFYNLSGQQ